MAPEFFFYFKLVFVLLFLIIMVLVVLKSLALVRRANDFMRNGVETEGRVVDSWQKVSNGNSQFAAVVEYAGMDGKSYRAKSDKFSNYPPEMGDTLPVYYKSSDPAFGMVNPGAAKTGAVVTVVIVLLMLTGLGGLFYWVIGMHWL